jgi:hypothetical protein
LQAPAHDFHEEIERRIRQVAEQAPRYIAMLAHRPQLDPDREAMLAVSRTRLRLIHNQGQQLLDATPTRPERSQFTKRERPARRNMRHGK